ncbi:hypothetical protein H2199_001343 [Coniosporium tulheliwenetii]|nr:hypothetical protein H2199_001343 [Cladosporium sp. JES 115]
MDIDERTSGALPAHPECLQIFVKALVNACGDSTITRFEDVDLQRFFECLAPKREDWLSCLTLYYGPLMDENKHEQDFYLRPGMEPYVTNPMDVPALRNVLERASRPTGAPEISDIFPPGPVGNISTDPFNKLPPELIVEIMLYLPSNSLSKLTAASPTAYAATRSNWFWRRRLTVDMPWLWELSEPSYVPDKGVPDWKAVYQHLSKASFAPSETDPSLLGLANRGRIWGVCEQVLELYLGHQEPKKPAELEEHEVD